MGRRASLRPVGAALGLALLAASVPVPAGAQADSASGGDPLAGSRVFGTKGCASCHGIRGVGGGVGPDLGRVAETRSFENLASALWSHLPGMRRRMRERGVDPPRLDPQESADLMAFLFAFEYLTPRGDPAAGERVFREKKCVVCHQIGGSGGVVGPALDSVGRAASPLEIAAVMWNHGAGMSEAMRSRGIVRPTFSEAELTDLVSYLRTAASGTAPGPFAAISGRADRGRVLLGEKQCLTCHSIAGQGGRLASDLARGRAQATPMGFAAGLWNKAPTMTRAMQTLGLEAPQLSGGEMADIVAFLESVRYFAGSGDPARGERAVREGECAACHAPESGPGGPAPSLARLRGSIPSDAALLAALWNHLAVAGEADDASWPRPGPDEMAHISAFLKAAPAQ